MCNKGEVEDSERKASICTYKAKLGPHLEAAWKGNSFPVIIQLPFLGDPNGTNSPFSITIPYSISA